MAASGFLALLNEVARLLDDVLGWVSWRLKKPMGSREMLRASTFSHNPRNLSWITKVCANPGQRLAKVKFGEQPNRLPTKFNFH